MPTLGAMKTRIRRELRRGATLDADLDDAIKDAISAYRGQRFWWAESRTQAAFPTVAGQEFYTAADDEALGRLFSIDWMTVTVGSQVYRLARRLPEDLDTLSNGLVANQPSSFAWYEETLRLYPIPSGVFPIRVAGIFSAPAPASEGETGNPWMTHGERLIRSRAKFELAAHRIRDQQLATDMATLTEEAFRQIKGESNRKTGTGYVEPYF